MRLAEMLARPVTALRDYRVEPAVKRDSNGERRNAARDRYLEAMGEEWVTGTELERRLGLADQSAFHWLARAHKAGIIERRPVGGTFSRSRGWEWRRK